VGQKDNTRQAVKVRPSIDSARLCGN
jgi:hypothetical protein